MFENIREDFRNYNKKIEWGFIAMLIYRFGRWRYRIKNSFIRKPFSLIYKILFFYIKGKGIEIPCEVEVGKNFKIDHQGGIIINGYSKIGNNCRIRHNVTLGIARVGETKAPIIGDNVDIGAGAILIGDIKIGNNVLIGAGAVVLTDVPDNCTVVGVPARIIKR
ncbi:serine O-acetyltransferase [Hypnocyclicus thermotrophus]|uniref:Serine acetyltransferase n=1 Tax=Hypnocyclicus thermotrophus TaxID=1627895 RepID=A0AA46E0C7_9FUSO|nr:serine O-acetyltransferase [Hypnocyclicus thermotrophus]TDT72449.1 serine O-acetyltransferase [Hypnocyclicus thermotrophus]